MKFSNIASFLALFLLPCAAATATTPQLMDELVLGGKRYHIYQVPMLGYWDYGDGSIGKGQVKPPHFDFSSTANSAGYQATWEITDSKLKLRRITGRIDGRRVKNRKIIDKKYPVTAKWFSGQVHLPIGDYDSTTGKYTAVISFHIVEGVVTKMTFHESAIVPTSWNGVAAKRKDVD